MSDLKSLIKNVAPAPVWEKLSLARSRLRPDAEWYFSRKRRQSVRRVHRLKNKHAGERCFIIGNGPSLNKMDLTLLEGEATFGLNRIYLLFDKLGFATTYYVAINRLVIEQCGHDLAGIRSPKFISWHARDCIDFTSDMMFLRDPYMDPPTFSTDIGRSIWEGATVTYAAMQIAYYLGFSEVILIGVDHNFQTKGTPNETVVSTGGDPNHFDPNYFGAGFRWQLPDLETSELAYRMAKYWFACNGRRILDATVDGKLTVFPKVDYESVIKS